MRNRSNTVWYVIIGIAVVLAVVIVTLVLTRDNAQEPEPAPSPSVTTSAPSPTTAAPATSTASASDSTPPPAGLDPADFEGHPPAVLLEPLVAPWGGTNVPLPDSIAEFVIDPAVKDVGLGNSSAVYSAGEGRSFTFTIHPAFGSYNSMMRSITDHRQVGISVCGDFPEGSSCAAAAEDTDLTISPVRGSSFTDEEFDQLLQAFAEWYLAQA